MHRAPHPLDARRHTGTFTLVRSMMLGVFIAGCRHHKTPTVPKWAIVVSKSNLDFSATAGGQLPAAQTFDVSGGAVSVSSDRAWLTVTPTVVSSATTVTVSVNTAGMSAGSSTGTITVSASSSNASNSPQRITVSLLLTPGPKIAVAPDNLGFDAVVGQPNTVVDSFHITNSGGGTLSNLRAIGTFPWLTATMNGASAPATVTVRATPGALARGTYRDTIVVTSTADGVSNSPLKVPVRFTISNPPAIGYTPNTAVKFAKAGNAANPADQAVTIINTGEGTLNGLVVDPPIYGPAGNGWLTATLASDVAPAQLTLRVTTAGRAEGVYTADVRVRSTASGAVTINPMIIPVTLTITAPAVATRAQKCGGDGQTGTVAQLLSDSLAVCVYDQFDNPFAGATVTWTPGGTAGASPRATSTGGNGIARLGWTFGTTVGNYAIDAAVSGIATHLSFTETALAGPAASITRQGDAQTGVVGTSLPDSLGVVVTDAYGNVIPHATITWRETSGGRITGGADTTNSLGIAHAHWLLGTKAGSVAATATVGGLTANFSAVAIHGPAAHAKFSPLPTVVLENAPLNVTAQVVDQFNNPVPGINIDWEAPDSYTDAPTAVSDASGFVRTIWHMPRYEGDSWLFVSSSAFRDSTSETVRFPDSIGLTTTSGVPIPFPDPLELRGSYDVILNVYSADHLVIPDVPVDIEYPSDTRVRFEDPATGVVLSGAPRSAGALRTSTSAPTTNRMPSPRRAQPLQRPRITGGAPSRSIALPLVVARLYSGHVIRVKGVAQGTSRVGFAIDSDGDPFDFALQFTVNDPAKSLVVQGPDTVSVTVGDSALFHVEAVDNSGNVVQPTWPEGFRRMNWTVGSDSGRYLKIRTKDSVEYTRYAHISTFDDAFTPLIDPDTITISIVADGGNLRRDVVLIIKPAPNANRIPRGAPVVRARAEQPPGEAPDVSSSVSALPPPAGPVTERGSPEVGVRDPSGPR